MSLRLLTLLSLLLLTFLPAEAKEKASSSYRPFVCPSEEPACHELSKQTPKETSFETLIFDRAVDGDTFMASGRRIRVWGIDAPEKGTPAYTASSWLLQSLLKEGHLSCKLVDVDKYKREVMHCLIDGLDIGAMMVKVGMARDYTKYSGGYYQQEQNRAKVEKRGIWKLSEQP